MRTHTGIKWISFVISAPPRYNIIRHRPVMNLYIYMGSLPYIYYVIPWGWGFKYMLIRVLFVRRAGPCTAKPCCLALPSCLILTTRPTLTRIRQNEENWTTFPACQTGNRLMYLEDLFRSHGIQWCTQSILLRIGIQQCGGRRWIQSPFQRRRWCRIRFQRIGGRRQYNS